MVQIRATVHRALPQLVLAVLSGAGLSAADPRFYPDDPLWVLPEPRNAQVKPRKTDTFYDFLKQSFQMDRRPATPAHGINTLGEVPDSEWYTNRHRSRRMTLEEMRRGPGNGNPPTPPFRVVGGKIDGITPGFRMVDANANLYFVKPDPQTNPEMATAADVLGSRFFYALGYNTPENYIVYVKSEDLVIGSEASVKGLDYKKRPMNRRDLADILRNVPRRKDGSIRLLASRAIQGQPLGPFRYEKTRRDDPNDTIPHENRRDLRGLHVFCAWLNHTDAKSVNSLDVLVEGAGRRFVRHYLIDFGAILGSDSDMPKNARFGNEFIIPRGKEALKRMVSLGIDAEPWEAANYGNLKSVGRLESQVFDPENWKSNYPNPAFLSRQPDDEFWAARQVMTFSNDEIRAIVETGQYSDLKAVDYITDTLIRRRDKIGRTYFAKVLPVDGFRVENGELRFVDLLAKYGIGQVGSLTFAWSVFDNQSSTTRAIPEEATRRIPSTNPRDFLAVNVGTPADAKRTVTVYLKPGASGYTVVGLDRKW